MHIHMYISCSCECKWPQVRARNTMCVVISVCILHMYDYAHINWANCLPHMFHWSFHRLLTGKADPNSFSMCLSVSPSSGHCFPGWWKMRWCVSHTEETRCHQLRPHPILEYAPPAKMIHLFFQRPKWYTIKRSLKETKLQLNTLHCSHCWHSPQSSSALQQFHTSHPTLDMVLARVRLKNMGTRAEPSMSEEVRKRDTTA